MNKTGYASSHTQVKVSVKQETAASFKKACEASNVSMASVISRFMEQFNGAAVKKPDYSPDLSTRRQRRAAIITMVRLLGRVLDNETRYMDNIPDNLQSGTAYENAGHCISTLEEVIDLLLSAY